MLVVDGGDCFQGSAVAALSKGQAIVPLVNRVRYDLVLPGNWEVVYGKEMMIKDLEHVQRGQGLREHVPRQRHRNAT